MSENTLSLIKEHEVKWIDLRFTDSKGKEQHVTIPVSEVDEEFFEDGKMFDGSSITGWKAINESDMTLMPDPTSAVMDPFAARPTLVVFCDIHDPLSGEGYERDPRSVAKRAEAYLGSTGIGDTAYFGPEAEFFMFDDVRFANTSHHTFYKLSDVEAPFMSGEEIEGGNSGHRPGVKGGYFPVQPVDSGADIRSEMVEVCKEMGLSVEKHHHEVAPSQHELGMKFTTLVAAADEMQKQNMSFTTSPMPMARQSPLCLSRYPATMVRACIRICRSGKTASLPSRVPAMRTSPRLRFSTLAA